jgi:hypothetical protein
MDKDTGEALVDEFEKEVESKKLRMHKSGLVNYHIGRPRGAHNNALRLSVEILRGIVRKLIKNTDGNTKEVPGDAPGEGDAHPLSRARSRR